MAGRYLRDARSAPAGWTAPCSPGEWTRLVLNTASVPDQEKLAYWSRAMARALVPMTVTPRRNGPFAGRITAVRCGYVRVSTLEADPQRATRAPRLITRSEQQFLMV